ncbi:MAG TPA: PfkB family carbohydrate kinase, partial [Acidimicrobiales bacterium]
MTGPIVVIGDALLDRDLVGVAERLAPDTPVPVIDDITDTARPGGAGLAALMVARDGVEVVLVTGLGDDAAGHEVARLLQAEGVDVRAAHLPGPTPQKTRIRAGDHAVARLDYGGQSVVIEAGWADGIKRIVAGADGVLISDYGQGVAAHPDVWAALVQRGKRRPTVWDPHPRGGPPGPG